MLFDMVGAVHHNRLNHRYCYDVFIRVAPPAVAHLGPGYHSELELIAAHSSVQCTYKAIAPIPWKFQTA